MYYVFIFSLSSSWILQVTGLRLDGDEVTGVVTDRGEIKIAPGDQVQTIKVATTFAVSIANLRVGLDFCYTCDHPVCKLCTTPPPPASRVDLWQCRNYWLDMT